LFSIALHAFDNFKSKLKAAFKKKPKDAAAPATDAALAADPATTAAPAPAAAAAAATEATKTETAPAAAPAAAPTGECLFYSAMMPVGGKRGGVERINRLTKLGNHSRHCNRCS